MSLMRNLLAMSMNLTCEQAVFFVEAGGLLAGNKLKVVGTIVFMSKCVRVSVLGFPIMLSCLRIVFVSCVTVTLIPLNSVLIRTVCVCCVCLWVFVVS